MKPLAAWTRDLVLRVEQLAKWAQTAHPPTIFWMSGFTFPTGFLTAVLQTSARQNSVRSSPLLEKEGMGKGSRQSACLIVGWLLDVLAAC